VLGARQSAVFSVPARAAIMEADYRAACAIAQARSDPPRMVSKQMFNIFPKICEVDALMMPALQSRVKEVHPEVAFAAMNGWTPLALPKKVKSQPHAPGLALRRGLLVAAGYDEALFATTFKRRDAGPCGLLVDGRPHCAGRSAVLPRRAAARCEGIALRNLGLIPARKMVDR
jgi:predicted RNase H-like nuclease